MTLLLTATAGAVVINRKISEGMPAFGDAEYFEISPNGQYAVYIADQEADDIYELYRAPLAGRAAPVKLNSPLVSGGSIDFNFQE